MVFDDEILSERKSLLGPGGSAGEFYESTGWRMISGLLWTILVTAVWFAVIYYPMLRNNAEATEPAVLLKTAASRALPVVLLLGPAVMIVASGGLDLSVGAVVSLVSVITAMKISLDQADAAQAIAAGIGAAAIIGLINAFLTGVVGINGALVTLGVMVFLGNYAVYYAGPNKVIPVPEGELDVLVSNPITWGLGIGFVVLCALLVQFTPFGVRPGPNDEPESRFRRAICVGLPYLMSSLMAGVVGILLLCSQRIGTPVLGVNLEIRVLVAVAVGGTVIGCGFGNTSGAIIGAMIMALTRMQVGKMEESGQVVMMWTAGGLVVAALAAKIYYGMVSSMFQSKRARRAPKL